MSHISGDLRVRRTQKLIREAFIALIEERGFDALTVADIASRAMVSRTAFYRYYEDKYDMVMKLFEEIVTTMNNELDSYRREAVDNMNAQASLHSWGELFLYTEDVLPPYVWLFEHVAEYERLYRALLGKRGSTWFVINLRRACVPTMNARRRLLAGRADGSMRVCLSRNKHMILMHAHLSDLETRQRKRKCNQ